MAKIVNLARARKQRARADRRDAASQNAARHGQSKSERDLTRARQDQEDTRLDQHRLDPASDPDQDTE